MIDLKKLQSVLHNVQQVMAGYSQDDTWSDYDRQSHTELIEMQYIVEDEIKTICTCITNKSGLVIEKCLNH